jgi:hypothetical protein
MKKLIAILLLTLTAGTALAQHGGHGIRHGHNHHRHHFYGGNNWMAPLIIGSTLGYVLTRPAPVYVEPPVYIQPQPMAQPQCTRYTRYIYQDQSGQVIREEIRCD